MESESRWLQKALFALNKAGDDRTKLEKVQDGAEQSMPVMIDGTSYDVTTVSSAVTEAVMERVEELQVALGRRRTTS